MENVWNETDHVKFNLNSVWNETDHVKFNLNSVWNETDHVKFSLNSVVKLLTQICSTNKTPQKLCIFFK